MELRSFVQQAYVSANKLRFESEEIKLNVLFGLGIYAVLLVKDLIGGASKCSLRFESILGAAIFFSRRFL